MGWLAPHLFFLSSNPPLLALGWGLGWRAATAAAAAWAPLAFPPPILRLIG